MSKYIINGGIKLKGEVTSPGNKNAILPIMAAAILSNQDCVIHNVPVINDVLVMGEILQDLAAKVEGLGTSTLVINGRNINKTDLNPELVKKLRASILCLGPLLARFGRASMRHPGGCIIGRRAVGTHFEALERLGADIKIEGEFYDAKAKHLSGTRIFLDEASVTATENAIMLAVLTPGTTIIEDAAAEPHVEDLSRFLNTLGARIAGAGTNRVAIEGVTRLGGGETTISADHVDIGTFVIMSAVTGGDIVIRNIKPEYLDMPLLYFRRLGLTILVDGTDLIVKPSKLASEGTTKFQTRTWPGFPSDLMSPLVVMATQTTGSTLCHDWMYENRMFFVDKLISMGAKITVCDPHRVLVVGPSILHGKTVDSPDIRAGVALIVAALCAQGESVVNNADIIDRGYENIEARLVALGADIKKVT